MAASGDNSPATRRELVAARAFYNHAEYHNAGKLYAQVLAFEPTNAAALEGKALLDEADAAISWKKSLGCGEMNESYPAMPTPYESTIQPWDAKDRTTVLALKLSKIILPEVSIEEMKLSQAIAYLEEENRRFDPDPNEADRGVKIFLKTQDPPPKYNVPAKLPEQADVIISLRLRNASLDEALDFAAQQAGLRLIIDAGQVSLVQERSLDGNGMRVARFRAPPKLTETLNSQVRPPYMHGTQTVFGGHIELPRADARAYLESQGIEFPLGASACYIPPGSFFVGNQPHLLDKLEEWVDRADGVGRPPSD